MKGFPFAWTLSPWSCLRSYFASLFLKTSEGRILDDLFGIVRLRFRSAHPDLLKLGFGPFMKTGA
jgi:hypothetical protein